LINAKVVSFDDIKALTGKKILKRWPGIVAPKTFKRDKSLKSKVDKKAMMMELADDNEINMVEM
jgi:hypothetical protein